MKDKLRFESVAQYVASFPKATQRALKVLQKLVRVVVPDADESISYQIPVFKRGGKAVVYLAAYESHVGLYGLLTAGVRKKMGKRLQPFVSGKGTLRFSLAEPLPAELIKEAVQVRSAEIA